MSTFVLVHGGWHGAWAWRRVTEWLQAAGHRLFVPTLTGLADRCHLLTREVNLSTHVRDVVSMFEWERLDGVVLCGHSYGGMVITAVADRIPQRIRALVYADAFLPSDGANLLDLVEEDRRKLLLRGAMEQGDGWKVPPPPAAAWDLVDTADQEWVNSLTTPHPLAAMKENVRLSGAWRTISRKTYIAATEYRRPTFRRLAEGLGSGADWTIKHLRCGHEVMIERSDELAQILLESAT